MQCFASRAVLAMALVLGVGAAAAEGDAPAGLGKLVGQDLEAGQDRLTGWNYEIVHSTLAGGSQHWWNNAAESCVVLKFDGNKKISAAGAVADQECREFVKRAAGALPPPPAPVNPQP